jgi:hypothetical protein
LAECGNPAILYGPSSRLQLLHLGQMANARSGRTTDRRQELNETGHRRVRVPGREAQLHFEHGPALRVGDLQYGDDGAGDDETDATVSTVQERCQRAGAPQ